MDKSKLIVLSERTSRGWGEDAKDALIYNLANSELIVASNFDAATMSWSSGRYFADANAAIAHFHGNPDPRWSIPGCTPDDVLGLYGEEHGLSIDDARGIADRVNAALGADDDLFRDELHRQVTGYRAATRHAQETVAGTMTLDCNGYDYLLCADSRSAPTEHAGRAASEEAFAVIRYSTSMIEEAMAKEGIPSRSPTSPPCGSASPRPSSRTRAKTRPSPSGRRSPTPSQPCCATPPPVSPRKRRPRIASTPMSRACAQGSRPDAERRVPPCRRPLTPTCPEPACCPSRGTPKDPGRLAGCPTPRWPRPRRDGAGLPCERLPAARVLGAEDALRARRVRPVHGRRRGGRRPRDLGGKPGVLGPAMGRSRNPRGRDGRSRREPRPPREGGMDGLPARESAEKRAPRAAPDARSPGQRAGQAAPNGPKDRRRRGAARPVRPAGKLRVRRERR